MTMPSRVAHSSFTSWRLAPSMTMAKGMPAPSVKRLRLVPFLPRSVGLAPVAAFPRGAFVIAPSTACHSHWIPSSSSYTCSPACHNLRKKAFCSHCLSAIMYCRTGSQCSCQRIPPRSQFVPHRQERQMLADPACEDVLLSYAMGVAGSGVLLVPTMHRSLPTGGFCSSTVLLFRISPSKDRRFTGSTLKTSQPPSPYLCLPSSKNTKNTSYALR